MRMQLWSENLKEINRLEGRQFETHRKRYNIVTCMCDIWFGLVTIFIDYLYSRVEAGSNTSTVALRVGGGEEKGNLESERVKYGHESHGNRTRK
jgi:hypothetical protein